MNWKVSIVPTLLLVKELSVYQGRIVQDIFDANPERSHDCIRRRLLKILEELGEGSEAYLSITGSSNYKNKSWEDYREEGVDTLIVMVDVALTSLPDSNWPAAAFIDLYIDEGRQQAVRDFDEMEAVKFDVARAVCSADYFLRQKDGQNGFYGAVARGVKAAARLCYARPPRDDLNESEDEAEERVYKILQKKLDKWRGRSTAKVLSPELKPKMTKPTVAIEAVDAKTYFEKFED